jgi:SOS response regulatory protein OraA/RecX
METLTNLTAAFRALRSRRRSRARLRRELMEYRTPAERQEIQTILARYETTVEDLLAGREPTPTTREPSAERNWEDAWDEIVLDLSSDDFSSDD